MLFLFNADKAKEKSKKVNERNLKKKNRDGMKYIKQCIKNAISSGKDYCNVHPYNVTDKNIKDIESMGYIVVVNRYNGSYDIHWSCKNGKKLGEL